MNPIFNITNVVPMQNEIKNMYKMFQSYGNPIQAFMKMANYNPNMKPIVDALRNGGNPEAIARDLLTKRGINPDEFIKGLMSD